MPDMQRFEMPLGLYETQRSTAQLAPLGLAPSSLHSRLLLTLASVLALCVFAFDAFTEYNVAIAVLYVVVVQMAAASGSLRATSAAATICAVLTVFALFWAHETDLPGGALARCAISLCALATATAISIRHLRNTDSLREYVQLLNLTHDAIIVYDLDGNIKFWNNGAQALYGWSSHEAVGKDIHALTKTRFPESREALYAELLRDGHWEGEVERQHRDGARMAVESRIALWRDSRGRAVAIMATNNNVTARRQTERELERSHAYAAEAERLSKTGSVMRFAARREMHWSQECFRILGVSPETEPSLDVVIERTHPDDIDLVKAMDQAIRDGKPLIDGTHRLLMPNGEVKHVRFVARLNASGANVSKEYVGALMDITAVVAAQEALRRSMTELAHVMRLTTLGGLATTIAHEVTQPLAAIVTCADTALCWLDRPEPEIAEAKVAIDQIILDAERSTEIVKQIRAMAQKREPECVAVSVNALVSDAVRLVSRECRAALVDLRVELHPADPRVNGDPVQLQQVLVNLFMNAIQAMAETGEQRRSLKVRTSLENSSAAQIDVMDSGPGFADGAIDKIFGAFYTTKDSGLGMGLSICRSIIEAHGGRIWAEAGNPGAIFRIKLGLAMEGAA